MLWVCGEGALLSVTVTVIENVPVASGVPEITPVAGLMTSPSVCEL